MQSVITPEMAAFAASMKAALLLMPLPPPSIPGTKVRFANLILPILFIICACLPTLCYVPAAAGLAPG